MKSNRKESRLKRLVESFLPKNKISYLKSISKTSQTNVSHCLNENCSLFITNISNMTFFKFNKYNRF